MTDEIKLDQTGLYVRVDFSDDQAVNLPWQVLTTGPGFRVIGPMPAMGGADVVKRMFGDAATILNYHDVEAILSAPPT